MAAYDEKFSHAAASRVKFAGSAKRMLQFRYATRHGRSDSGKTGAKCSPGRFG